MTDLRITAIRVDRNPPDVAIEIQMMTALPSGRSGHRIGPDEIPDDIARALRRWLGYIDVPDKGDRRA